MEIPALDSHLKKQLEAIEPSLKWSGAVLYPAKAELKNGTVLPCVYFVSESEYRKMAMGRMPIDFSGPHWVSPTDVSAIHESPMRLPPKFARELDRAGETRMGSYGFSVGFSWWRWREYTQSVVDFIEYPPGKGPGDVRKVYSHVGGRQGTPAPEPAVYWCMFSDPG
jgi:hypothetical protein